MHDLAHKPEYNMEIKDLGKKKFRIWIIESQRELESQRQQLRRASQWADDAHRERIILRGELELRKCFHSKLPEEEHH